MGFARGLLSTTTPAQDLRTAIENLMPASGWSLVDTYTGTSPADSVRVWLNPAANNASGIDFYVALGIKAGTTNAFYAGIAQIYNPATHLARKYAPISSGASFTTDTDYTVADASGKLFEVASATYNAQGSSLSVTGQGYAVQVTKDYIWFNGVSNLNSSAGFVGRFVRDSAFPADNCLIVFSSNNYVPGSSGATTNGSISSSTQFLVAANGTAVTTWSISPIVDGPAIGNNTDLLNGSKPIFMRVLAYTPSPYYRGYFRDALWTPSSTFSFYDDDITITISGTTYTYGRMGSQFYVNKAAV